jgi:hypothetical protein
MGTLAKSPLNFAGIAKISNNPGRRGDAPPQVQESFPTRRRQQWKPLKTLARSALW